MELQAKGVIKTGSDRNTNNTLTYTDLAAIHHECNVEVDGNLESMSR